MPSELERRLEDALTALPGPGAEAGAQARRTALDALQAPAARVAWRRPLALAAAIAAVLVAGAAALAAIGTINVTLRSSRHAAAPVQLQVPPGARGIALVAGGRLYFATRDGVRIEGLRVSAAALSPHALYVAVGIGRSLVVMAPNGRRAWTRHTGGAVVAAAWAPSALRIAYVVRRAHGFQLRVVEGDGDHDRLVDGAVRSVAPSWRADSLALAYAGIGGSVVVYDLGHESRRVVEGSLCGGSGPVAQLAFAASGRSLAFSTPGAVYLDRGAGGAATCVPVAPLAVGALAWSRSGNVIAAFVPAARLAAAQPGVQALQPRPDGELLGFEGAVADAWVLALAPSRNGLLAAVERAGPGRLRVVLASPPPARLSYRALHVQRVLFELRAPAAGAVIAVS